jgi:hypothetical protein
MGRSSVLVVLALAALGCGASTSDRQARPSWGRCVAAAAPGFRLCGQPTEARRRVGSTIQRRSGDGWEVLAAAPPGSVAEGEPHGYWQSAWLSPDRRTLLAQWSGECEIPIAFFVDADDGDARPVTGERDWTKSPESVAVGWRGDGRARVLLPKGACASGAERPGYYLIDPASAQLTWIAPAPASG